MSAVNLDLIVCKGGLDQVTPTLSLPNTYARYSLNFEAAVTGGYTRIPGYERFDGQASPTDSSTQYKVLYVYDIADPTPGTAITSSSGGSGIIAHVKSSEVVYTGGALPDHVRDVYLYVIESTGSFNPSDDVTIGGLVVTPIQNLGGNDTPEESAQSTSAIADYYRAFIEAVPGSGPVRGVTMFKDVVYTFRDNLLGTACDIYKSSTSGWVNVPCLQKVAFVAGGDEPPEGATITKGGVTATIRRVARYSGSWSAAADSDKAVGIFVIDTLAGGHFSVGAATTSWTSPTAGSGTCTLLGAEEDITLQPGPDKVELEEHNFGGQSATNRLYGCSGNDQCFEFDGEILVPISTGAATDTPAHLVTHKNQLFVSLGGSVIHSAPGLPYCFSAIEGASEIATGADVTGMIVMPGGTGTATLGIFNRSNTLILYGNSIADWNLVAYNTGTGAIPGSLQNMAQTYAMDDRGVNTVSTALQYGNFSSSTLTNQVLPFINERINRVTASTLCRRKSQYRVFFSDGFGLHITVSNGKLIGCMPVYFPDPVYCCYEGKDSTGQDVILFGSDNGFVYQMERGTSFDGESIEYSLQMNYSNAKSPRTLKRYRKCVPEVMSAAGPIAKFALAYYLGYNSENYSQPVADMYTKMVGQRRWDNLTWDQLFWDVNSVDFMECPLDGTAENIALVLNGSYNYIPEFTINSFMVHYSPRRLMR